MAEYTPFQDAYPYPVQRINAKIFKKLNDTYLDKYGMSVVYCDAGGNLLDGLPDCSSFPCQKPCSECRQKAIEAALNSGRPSVDLCHREQTIWALPLVIKGEVYGALTVVGTGFTVGDDINPREYDHNVSKACYGLQELAETFRITEPTFLKNRAMRHGTQAEDHLNLSPSHQIEKFKQLEFFQEIYTEAEPKILKAIKESERDLAHNLIQEMIGKIRQTHSHRLDLLKGFALEILFTINRATFESTGDLSFVFHLNYEAAHFLSSIYDENGLFNWLDDAVVRSLDVLQTHSSDNNAVLLRKAMNFMEKNLARNLSRAEVAKNSGISTSHLSHLLRRKTGKTFSELLNQHRVHKAAQMLLRTPKTLSEIALETGFCDQSYFSKIFRRHYGISPTQYRREHS